MKIIQLVACPPSFLGGHGTYALNLAEKLLKEYGIFTHFLLRFSFYQDFQIPSTINGFPIQILPKGNLEAFLPCIPEDINTIILHYSQSEGGGFSNQYRSMKVLQSAVKLRRLKLIVMFHELSLTLSFKNKIKFLYPLRFFAARGIAGSAISSLTFSAGHQSILSQWLKMPITCLPVFSTIGEPNYVDSLLKRKRRMIVFGAGYSRERVYKRYLKELLLSCQILGIEEICDIGNQAGLEIPKLVGIPIVKMGEPSNEVVSQLMLSSYAGFFDYSHCPQNIGKSTIVAAYCTHGLIPVSAIYDNLEATGLERNKNYVVADETLKDLTLVDLQFIVDNARQWYNTHSLREHAKVFASFLKVENVENVENELSSFRL